MASASEHRITGRVGKTPDLRFTPSGREVASFSVIYQPRRLNQQTQQWEDGDATWYEVTVWGRLAVNVAGSIEKGHEVTVVGTLKLGKMYTNKKNETVTPLELTATDVQIPLDHQIVQMIDKAAYGDKVSGGTGAPAGGYNNSNNSGYNSGNAGGGYSAPARNNDTADEPPF